MSSTRLLKDQKRSLLIVEERRRADIVIGSPHHAPSGVSSLPCLEHQVADENAGFIASRLAVELDCCCIIAGNYFIDSNKDKNSDYYRRIQQWNPEVFVEIHGHGGVSARHDIEISSGSREREHYSKALADTLFAQTAIVPELQDLTIGGDYRAIYFKASQSVTINTTNWITYHIELPKLIRVPQPGEIGDLGRLGELFVLTLARSLVSLHRDRNNNRQTSF